jgi:ribonuclease HI
VYTDGLFVQGSTGSAFIYDGQVFSYHLCSFNSIFTVELYAMYQVLVFIWCQSQQCHLCTDLLSVLQSLTGYTPNHVIIIEIVIQVSHLHKAGKSVVFCWIPDHTGLSGNKTTDAPAKAATLNRPLELSGSQQCFRTFLHCTVLSS